MDLALNNLQRLICHKTQPTTTTTNLIKNFRKQLQVIKMRGHPIDY